MSDFDVAVPEETSLQDQVEARDAAQRNKFGTFAGVFTPTLLTILGVIMFLREGWVVGNAGLVGAIGIPLYLLVTVVPDQQEADRASVYLKNLADLARLPKANVEIRQGNFMDVVAEENPVDLHIFGIPDEIDFVRMRSLVEITRSACLFVRDSGEENALA